MKRNILIMLCIALGMTLAGSYGALAAGKTTVLKAGHTVENTHPYQIGLEAFAKEFNKRTDGRYQVDIYHSSQLGTERDMTEGVGMGTLDFVITTNAPLTGFLPRLGVFDLPYLFISREHAHKVLDGPIGAELMNGADKKNLVFLAYFENGFRNITNSKQPIKVPDDMKGMKIRVMESKVHLATFRAFGANPTPMAWSEVFTALQQKTIDGQENPIMTLWNAKIYEVNPYLSMTEHFYSPAPFLTNKDFYNSLSAEDKKAMHEAAAVARQVQRDAAKEQNSGYVTKLAEKGMQVTEVDKGLFKEKAREVYQQFDKEFGDLIRRIEAESN